MSQSERYQAVEDAFRKGQIDATDSATLADYLTALSNQPLANERVQHRDVIRGITINHVLLQRHIADLDKKNALTQKLVVALTVASLIASGMQIWYAKRSDDRSEREDQQKATATSTTKPVASASPGVSSPPSPQASIASNQPASGSPR
jgi:hypothetical protein